MADSIGFSSEIVESVRILLASDAWGRFFIPSLENIKQTWLDTIVDPSKERQDKYSDDYLRGCIATINALVDLPQALIAEADAQAALREANQAQDEHFSTRADLGIH